jgi:hypothetical protein
MEKRIYGLGEKFEASADRMFAQLDELEQALLSIKARFPEMPIAEPGAQGSSLTWAPREQVPRNINILVPDWRMPQILDQRSPIGYQVEIRLSSAA